jgi:ABC-type transport system involved in cytochrome c biogenesis ATPase subunit
MTSPTESSLAIETRELGKRFGARAALDGVDLEVPRGVAFGFLGANGAGKTTLIRLLLGLARPTAGTMRLLGHDLPGGRAAALARVGAIIEEPRFHPHLSGRENLHVHAAARERAAHDRIDAALTRVGLAARADEKVKTYSLGMRQRLGVARCLLSDPEIVRGGPRAVDIVASNAVDAARLLAAVPGVLRATDHEGALRVTLSPEAPVDREIVTALLRRLLDHGVDVERVAPVQTSLEDRFLTMTTRLEDRS